MSSDSSDGYVLKLSSSGDVDTVFPITTISGPGDQLLFGLDVDGSESIAVTGTYTGRTSFGRPPTGSEIFLEKSANRRDGFVAKWDRFGTIIWAVRIRGDLNGLNVVTDQAGNVFVAGVFESTVTFDANDGGASRTLSSTLPFDTFLAKWSSDGGLAWQQTLGGVPGRTVNTVGLDSLSLDPAGNAYVLSNVGDGTTSSSEIVKVLSSGVVSWRTSLSGLGRAIEIAPSGDVYAGTTSVLARLTSGGAVSWSKNRHTRKLAVVTSESGATTQVLTLDDASGMAFYSSAAGDLIRSFAGPPSVQSLAANDEGVIYAGGSFSGSKVFGGNAVPLTSLGSSDGYVAPINLCGDVVAEEAWTVGLEVSQPSCADAVMPEIVLDPSSGSTNVDDFFFWCPAVKRLYAVRPAKARIEWFVSGVPASSSLRVIEAGVSSWPSETPIHVAGAPVDLEREDTIASFRFSELHYSESNATVTPENQFNAMIPGYAVLRFAAGPDSDPSCGETGPAFEVVRTVTWDDSSFRTTASCEIPEAIADSAHTDPSGKNGYVLFENAHYDGVGEDRAYDRATRRGSILPVNVRQDGDDRMVVVWYGTEPEVASNVLVVWPDKSVEYNCAWPVDPPSIVIASQEGSGPIDPLLFPEARVYLQPDRNLPGFNPNEEHALIAPSASGTASALFALRSDLNSGETSEAYALLKYQDNSTGEWRMRAYQVIPEGYSHTWPWARSAGGASADRGRAIATDSQGNVYVAGVVSGNDLDFGGTLLNSAGLDDAFVGKMNPNGEWEWVRTAGGNLSDSAHSVAVDGSGNVYLSGGFRGTAAFGSGTNITLRTASSSAFVAKLDGDGTWQWAVSFGDERSVAGAVAVDGAGDVYLTGTFGGAASLNRSQGGVIFLSAAVDANCPFVAKLTPRGEWLWAKAANEEAQADVNAIAVDAEGEAHIGGLFATTIEFGATSLSTTSGAGFVSKLSSDGQTWLWASDAQSSAGPASTEILDVGVNDNGGVWVSGVAPGDAQFSGASSVTFPLPTKEGFVAHLQEATSTSIGWQWARQMGSWVSGLALDTTENLRVAGYYSGDRLIGGDDSTSGPLQPRGGADIFVAKLVGSDGTITWSTDAGGLEDDTARAVAIGPDGSIYVTGDTFSSLAIFGDDDMTARTVANSGGSDIFVARLSSKLHTFDFTGTAGTVIQPPYPLSLFLPSCTETDGRSGPFWVDYKGTLWARAAGNVVARFFYRLQPGFYDESGLGAGSCVPWLDGLDGGTSGVPVDARYTISWPTQAPELRVGETLTKPKRGLPNIIDQASARVIYDESVAAGTGPLVKLYDPLSKHQVTLNALPSEADFSALPFHLRARIEYDTRLKELSFGGFLDTRSVGEPLLLPNVMSRQERDELLALSTEPAYQTSIRDLYRLGRNPGDLSAVATVQNPLFPQSRYPEAPPIPYTLAGWEPPIGLEENARGEIVPIQLAGRPMALTAGAAPTSGFVSVIFNDDESLDPLPVSVSVFRVACPVYTGEIKVIESDNVFDEALTLRHSGDFGGDSDNFDFEWFYHPDTTGTPPITLPLDSSGNPIGSWVRFGGSPTGQNSITISGPRLLTISDNWFLLRYKYRGLSPATRELFDCDTASNPAFSGWAGSPGATTRPLPQLAEGWVKRVVRGLNPFEQRLSDFRQGPVNTFADMLIQAGARYEGDIPFSGDPESINNIGLIEAYETVLRRAMTLSIDGSPPVNYGPANTSLLLASGRIADLYMLLGNEAFADAADPTIGFDTSGVFGTLAPSIFAFKNQLGSLLEEELTLLRGRDDSAAPVGAPPVYNRLFWNFTSGQGEVAYTQAYNITDQDIDGFIDETDARIRFPQGHGDAWGHYLSATKSYSRLLRHPNYRWEPRAESVLVAGAPVLVDYLDERKFALAAAAKAKTGAEIVNLTYRDRYVEDPAGQWQGYKDTDTDRAWGLSGWARRTGQGAYFDWLVANAILPSTDPNPDHSGIRKIDRTTVEEIGEIAAAAEVVQSQLDQADEGLNPLGLAKDVVPFDINPALIDRQELEAKTHFEQIWDRALDAMKNAVTVFDHANQLTQLLRRNQDTVDDFARNARETERDFNNRMIEIFGYPYSDDIGAPGPYREGYDGPDLLHFMYIDPTELTGEVSGQPQRIKEFTAVRRDDSGSVFTDTTVNVRYHTRPSGWGFTTDALGFTGERRAPGEIQEAISQFVQAGGRYRQAIAEYSHLIKRIESKRDLLVSAHNLREVQINALGATRTVNVTMNALIFAAKASETAFKRTAKLVDDTASATAEGVPQVVGLSTDAFSGLRSAIRGISIGVKSGLGIAADVASLSQFGFSQAKEFAQIVSDIVVTAATQDYAATQELKELGGMVREEVMLRLECFTLLEAQRQAYGKYLATLAKGERVLQGLIAFRKHLSSDVQDYRYRDMSFRLFRNDALQKYRAQFDLAARYVYLAAKAYDYETNLLGNDQGGGESFFTEIVRQRSLGQLSGDTPIVGTVGLADPLARMGRNFAVLGPQLGFNNPQTETNYFSLRSELFRVRPHNPTTPNATDDAAWRDTLRRHRVADLWDVPEFRRFCRPFAPETDAAGNRVRQPGIVIPFDTTVTFGLNFFGEQLGGGDSSYDSSNFSTKIRSVGVWLSNYNATGLSRTPRVYLVPAGLDVMRSPSGDTLATREFSVVDQRMPAPFLMGASDLEDPDWIPAVDSLSADMAEIRRHSSFRAYHDSGYNEDEMSYDSRLIGRSVWNRRWVLIIPGGTFLFDGKDGLDTLVEGEARDGEGIKDIRLFFQTYAASGN
ncbi:MAG: SBBP repeat-containing protein [Planctomycetota bacterium]